MTTPSPQRARRILTWALLIAFVAIPIAEFWVVTQVGGLIGLANGFLVTSLRLNAFITTLAMGLAEFLRIRATRNQGNN